jgi:hypothetical protein
MAYVQAVNHVGLQVARANEPGAAGLGPYHCCIAASTRLRVEPIDKLFLNWMWRPVVAEAAGRVAGQGCAAGNPHPTLPGHIAEKKSRGSRARNLAQMEGRCKRRRGSRKGYRTGPRVSMRRGGPPDAIKLALRQVDGGRVDAVCCEVVAHALGAAACRVTEHFEAAIKAVQLQRVNAPAASRIELWGKSPAEGLPLLLPSNAAAPATKARDQR